MRQNKKRQQDKHQLGHIMVEHFNNGLFGVFSIFLAHSDNPPVHRLFCTMKACRVRQFPLRRIKFFHGMIAVHILLDAGGRRIREGLVGLHACFHGIAVVYPDQGAFRNEFA